VVEHLNVLFAFVPQRSPFPSMVKKSVTSLKTKPKHRFRLFLDGSISRMVKSSVTSSKPMAGLESCRSAKAELY